MLNLSYIRDQESFAARKIMKQRREGKQTNETYEPRGGLNKIKHLNLL